MNKPKINVKATAQRILRNLGKEAHAGLSPSPTKKGPGRFHDQGRRVERARIARMQLGI